MIRVYLASGFLVLSVLSVGTALFLGADTPEGNLLINLGTEIFGVLVTLAVVDLILERRRQQERGRELAWTTLHAIERAVWVWQGGPSRVGTDELLGLIGGIDPRVPPEPLTRSLLVSLGRRGREILDIEARVVKVVPGLHAAAQELSSLRALGEQGTSVTNRMVIEVLEGATAELARTLGQPTSKLPGALVRHRDASSEAQKARYYASPA